MIFLKRFLSPVIAFSFIIQSSFPIYAAQNNLLNLPEPGKMISLSSKFVPAYVKGISIYPNDPFKFDFIIDTGNTKLNDQQFKDESNRLIKYFMAALTVPEKEDWVNLSPYEKDRIVPESLGITEMGRDMLAQDYILKQLTSSLIYPEKEIGKEFWNKVYAQAQKQFGTTNIPVNTFNKVWIVPSQAVVWEHDNSAYVVRSHLKVMLEQDYLSLNRHLNNNIFSGSGKDQQVSQTTNAVGSDVVRAVVLPALEKEVNEGANFATLRQVFNSAILAAWYKQNLKQTILGQVYANQNKVTGIDLADKQVKQQIYERYLQAFKKGVFNFIKEDNDPATGQTVPRKYFSGGESLAINPKVITGNFAQLSEADRASIAGQVGLLSKVTVAAVDAAQASEELRRGFTVPEGQKENFFTMSYVSYNISSLLRRVRGEIPDEVVNAVRAHLNQEIQAGHLKGSWVHDFGGTDIDVIVTHHWGERNVDVHKIMLEAIIAGLNKAKELGLIKRNAGLTPQQLIKTLDIKSNEHSISERGSESVVVAKGVGVSVSAVNIKLIELFATLGATPFQKLGLPRTPGFRFIVEPLEDIQNGKHDNQLEFEIAVKRTASDKTYLAVNEGPQLLALAGASNHYAITAVYPVEGGALPVTEPMATVVYQPVRSTGGKRELNPTIIFRSQSGAEAVGGIGGVVERVNYVPGGQEGKYFVAVGPKTLEEARQQPAKGQGSWAYFGWQSRENGVIPPEKSGVEDHVGMNYPALSDERQEQRYLAGIMKFHSDNLDQPGMAPWATRELSESFWVKQASLFERAPSETEEDSRFTKLEDQVEKGELISVTDNKADVGGNLGHTRVPDYMNAVYRTSLQEGVQAGQFTDANIIGRIDDGRIEPGSTAVGDDQHLVMIGDRSRHALASHRISFTAFLRAIVFGTLAKPYGLAQDFLGREAVSAQQRPYFHSQFTPGFFAAVRKYIPHDWQWMADKVEEQWKQEQAGAKEVELPRPFSGNVQGQGIGSARLLFDPTKDTTFDIIAGDKMGPAAYNPTIKLAVYAALKAGDFPNGLVFEIWNTKAFDKDGNVAFGDIPGSYETVSTYFVMEEGEFNKLKPEDQTAFKEAQAWVEHVAYIDGHLNLALSDADKIKLGQILKKYGFVPSKRIFLDAFEDKDAVFAYLSDSDRYNVKHVWLKTQSGWDIHHPENYLDRPVLASSVTHLGVLAGGAYVGKDDPVKVGLSKLTQHVIDLLRDHIIIVQGDMNGSHWRALQPVKLKDAVATRNSDPIVIATRYTLSKEGKLLDVKDLFDTPEFDRMRNRVSHFNNRFWEAQNKGQHSPLGADPDQVEAAYPLRTTIDNIVAPGSEFRVEKRKQMPEYANRTFWPQVPANVNVPLYQAVASGDAAQSVADLHRDPLGGINLDANLYNMQVLRDGKGMPLPISQQPIGQFMKIKGFKPVLLNIERNINLPARLGVNFNRLPKEQLVESSSVTG